MPDENQINDAVDNIEAIHSESDSLTEQKHVPVNKSNMKLGHCGLDIGTMNLVSSIMTSEGTIESKSLRNVFLEIDEENVGTMDLSFVSHVKMDGKIYFLSEDAYNFANIFGQNVMRPMNKGLISSSEIDSIDILTVMIKSLVGEGSKDSICCYSVPADPIDSNINVIYHKNVFERILKQLNYKPLALNEAVAVVYSECANSDFTGIGISFGAGMTNVAVVFKSVPVLTFSVTRGGDWIDENAATSIGWVINRVTRIKEKDSFNLKDFTSSKKQERRVKEALIHYYRSLINYTTKHIISELNKINVEFPNDVPIILSGGTSKVSGFVDVVTSILDEYEFPFDISEISQASNPLTAVADGCLARSLRT